VKGISAAPISRVGGKEKRGVSPVSGGRRRRPWSAGMGAALMGFGDVFGSRREWRGGSRSSILRRREIRVK